MFNRKNLFLGLTLFLLTSTFVSADICTDGNVRDRWENNCPPNPCSVSWSPYTACTNDCGYGTQTRYYENPCTGVIYQTQTIGCLGTTCGEDYPLSIGDIAYSAYVASINKDVFSLGEIITISAYVTNSWCGNDIWPVALIATTGDQSVTLFSGKLTGGSISYSSKELVAPMAAGNYSVDFSGQINESISYIVPGCTGTIPENAKLCLDDNNDVTSVVNYSLKDSCGTPKCEHVCNTDYSLIGGNCVLTLAPTCTLDISPDSLNYSLVGENEATLTWETTNATSLTIDEDVGEVDLNNENGVTVNPQKTTTYIGTVEGSGGKNTCSQKVEIILPVPPPTPELITLDPTSVVPDGPSEPSDPSEPSITPENSCALNEGDNCESDPNDCGFTAEGTILCNGDCSVSPPDNPDYYGVTCLSAANSCYLTNLGAYDCDNVCNAITPGVENCLGPIINVFKTDDNVYFVDKGLTKILVWSGIKNATKCVVSGTSGENELTFPPFIYTDQQASNEGTISGSVETQSMEHSTEYTLTCYNGDGPTANSTSESFKINLVPSYQDI